MYHYSQECQVVFAQRACILIGIVVVVVVVVGVVVMDDVITTIWSLNVN